MVDVSDVPEPQQEAPEPKKQRTAPVWETTTRNRLQTALKRFVKPLNDLVSRDVNEADTRLFITDFLCEALGYDKYADLTTEYRVKNEYADYGLRIDKQLVAFIEVKRISTVLKTNHLRQVESYAVNEGVEWVILTNGVLWQVYHITGGLPVKIDLAFEINLLSDDSINKKIDLLFYLTQESLKRKQVDDLWKAKRAMSQKSLASILCSDAVIDAIRKELRRQTGYNTDAEEIIHSLKDTVILPKCFE